MNWLVLATVYLLVHFAVYGLILRNARRFLHERAIFLYHFLSALALAGLLLGALVLWPAGVSFPAAVAVLSLHGIYSLSFLELWSLAEGGYSLSILRRVRAMPGSSLSAPLIDLRSIGTSKKEARIQSLERLRLVRRRGDVFELAGFGSIAAAAFQGVSGTVNLKSRG